MSGHYDEAALYDYLDDAEGFAARAELEAHLKDCDRCRGALDQLREFEAALSSTALWELAEAVRKHTAPPDAIRSLADRLATEDADAEQFLTPLLTSPAAFRRANLSGSASVHSAGVVRKLCGVAKQLRERQPMHALELAASAVSIAEQLPADRYPESLLAELRGNAWLERANVLRYLGRFPEALDALDLAERAFSKGATAEYSVALTQYLRAVIFQKSDRLDEAIRFARTAARTFRQFGEVQRYVHAKMVEAGVLFMRADYDQALDLFLSLIPVAKQLGDADTLARLYGNVANSLLGREDRATASTYFGLALSLYEALGLETEKIRTRWSLGRLQLQSGEWDAAVERLRQSKMEFEALGMTSDAALVTLDLVEAQLARGERREVAQLCSGLVKSFTDVGMTGNALTALAFLQEAVTIGSATPVLIHHVREYLERMPAAAERPFLPPPRD